MTTTKTFTGLSLPVRVEIWEKDRLPGCRGKYVGIEDGHHLILIREDNVTPFVLTHELTHALQCERDFNFDFAALQAQAEADILAAVNATQSQPFTDLGKNHWILHTLVKREHRRGLTRTLDAYNNTPLEREANEKALA